MNNEITKINLQLFSEEETTVEESTEEGVAKETYTKEEVTMMLQKEADKRVTEALKKAEKTKAKAVAEAEKLAKMNEEDKYKYELEKRELAIQEKESQLALAENKSACTNILADRGIPVQLVDFVVDVDADAMQAKINTLDKYFKLGIKNEVEKRLTSATPRKNTVSDITLTKESFKKMSLAEINQLAEENPELFKQLQG